MDDRTYRVLIDWLRGIFLAALLVWTVAATIRQIPHGMGHSIESMEPVETVFSIFLPVWGGSFIALLGLLVARAAGGVPTPRESSTSPAES